MCIYIYNHTEYMDELFQPQAWARGQGPETERRMRGGECFAHGKTVHFPTIGILKWYNGNTLWGYMFYYVCLCLMCIYCIYIYMYVCMYVCMYACMYVCMYVCNYVCIYIYIYSSIYYRLHFTSGKLP